MNALTIKNSQDDLRVVVLTTSGVVRPVAMVIDDCTHQCVCNGDVVIYKKVESKDYTYGLYGNDDTIQAADVCVDKKTMADIKAFLDGQDNLLPENMGWNGNDTIQTIAIEMGLDKFLTGLDSTAYLGGLMNLDTSLVKPKIGSFPLKELLSNIQSNTVTNAASETQIANLVAPLEQIYKQWLEKNGICLPSDSKTWRQAKQLPNAMSVSCIIDNKGNPVRFNDLVIWRDLDGEPEVISVFDLVTTFKMNANFITLPYVIDEDVKRIMYVLHDKTLSNDGDNVVWLYKKC